MSRRLQNRELVAIMEDAAVKRGAFFFFFGSRPPANARKGSVAIVSIRGPLEHHSCYYSDSYEAILERVKCAMDGEVEPTSDDEGDYHHEPDGDETQATPPSCVILEIDSPGGVVAGLNETVMALRAMSKEHGIPLFAYVNELAASAAYALCCACERVICPASAIIGSVGVISTVVSQAEADKRMGIDVRLLTSGKRKADGHAHAPIKDEALAAEKRRLDQSALAFFRLVEDARDMSVKKIRALEAGIFQGGDAVRIGLADEVMSRSDVLLALDESDSPTSEPKADGNETDRRALDKMSRVGPRSVAQGGKSQRGTPRGEPEMLKLKALIKKTEAAIAAEKDPEKLAELYMSLSAYKKTEKHVEHTKSESDDDDDMDDDDDKKKDDEDDDEDDEKKSSKKSAAPEKDEKKSAKKDEESAKKDEEDDEESASASAEDEEESAASAILSLVKAAVPAGKKGKAMVGSLAALLEKAAGYDDLAARVAKIEGTGRKSRRETLIENALATRKITKSMAGKLSKMKLEAVQSALELFSGPLVHTDEDALASPDPDRAGARSPGGALSQESMDQIDLAVRGSGLTGDAAANLRQTMITNAKKTLADLNGASTGRY